MPIAKSNGTQEVITVATETADRIMAEGNRKILDTVQASNVPYVDAKSLRILRQGVYQAVLQSPGLAGLPYVNEEQYVSLVKSVSEKVIKLVEEK